MQVWAKRGSCRYPNNRGRLQQQRTPESRWYMVCVPRRSPQGRATRTPHGYVKVQQELALESAKLGSTTEGSTLLNILSVLSNLRDKSTTISNEPSTLLTIKILQISI